MSQTAPLLQVEHARVDEVAVIHVRGEVDLTSVGILDDAIEKAEGAGVVLDLTGVAFIDSAGIRAIDRAHRRLGESSRTLLVVAPPDSRAAWTFRIAGFGEGVVLESVEEAVAAASELP
jgi:anti-anti-sigma factor